MDKRPLPYYRWFWQDFRSSRKVAAMSYVERGLYRELLDECWVEGGISGDIENMAEICCCPIDIMANAWRTLSRCFYDDNGLLKNRKLEEQRTAIDMLRVKNAANGKKGGEAKAKQNQDESSERLPDASERLANSSALLKKSIRNSNSKEENNTTPHGLDFEHAWELYGKKSSSKKLSKQRWNALSNKQKELAMQHIPEYTKCFSDNQFQKNFEGYIRLEVWNDALPIFSKTDSKTEKFKRELEEELNG